MYKGTILLIGHNRYVFYSEHFQKFPQCGIKVPLFSLIFRTRGDLRSVGCGSRSIACIDRMDVWSTDHRLSTCSKSGVSDLIGTVRSQVMTAEIAYDRWTIRLILTARLKSDGRSKVKTYLTPSTWTHLKPPFPIKRLRLNRVVSIKRRCT